MKASELKFLLKLLGQQGYRAPLSHLKTSDKEKASDREKICKDLAEREIVGYSHDIRKFRIEPAGKGLLKQDQDVIPLPETHLAILKACDAKAIFPGDIPVKTLSAADRQIVIQELADKGLIRAEKIQIKDVWLTERGAEVLRDDLNPAGGTTLSFNLLGNYVTFLRKSMPTGVVPSSPPVSSPKLPKPDADAILQLIRELDQQHGTENYLPIFHLRNRVQPPLSREELDQLLYQLQRDDKLEMSSLVESVHFTPEQIQAGIPQDTAGPLFFLIVND